jgi:hypothetical protein
MRETYAPVILERKAARLRKANNNPHLRSRLHKGISASQILKRSILLPLKLLLFSPIVGLISLYVAFAYGLTFLLFATFPAVFDEQYHFSPGVSGLSYLGMGLGYLIGIGIFVAFSDKLLEAQAAKDALARDVEVAQQENERPNAAVKEAERETKDVETASKDAEEKDKDVERGTGDLGQNTNGTSGKESFKFKPEYRLFLMLLLTPVLPIGFFWYGWSADTATHWIVPILGTGVIGVSPTVHTLQRPLTALPARIFIHLHASANILGRHSRPGSCCECSGGKPAVEVIVRCVPPNGRTQDVRHAWVRLGEQFAGIHRFGIHANSISVLEVWRNDQKTLACHSLKVVRLARLIADGCRMWAHVLLYDPWGRSKWRYYNS